MKTVLILICVAGLLSGPISDVQAHQGDRIYSIVELSDADVSEIDLTDGSIGDWLDIVGDPTLTTGRDLDAWFKGNGYDPSDFEFRLWMGWHDTTDRLYVAMEQVDDVYINEFVRDASDYVRYMGNHDGSIALVVDGDHSGGMWSYGSKDFETLEERFLHSEQQAQMYMALAEVNDNGPHISGKEAIYPEFFSDLRPWFVLPPYADGGGGSIGEAPIITVTEFYVTPFDRLIWNSPEESVVSDLYLGKIIGLNLGVRDQDEEVGVAENYFYFPGPSSVPSQSADSFADFVLVGSDGSIPEITVVGSKSWGRIKASFKE